MTNKDIVLENEKLGIKTIFFYDENGVLGYCEDNVIYLNEFYKNHLEMINKHEVLHFFENSKQFIGVKKIAFDLLGKEKLDEIRMLYSLKYSGVYNEEDISNGVIDNEIVIDMIIGNGKFPFDLNDYVKEAYKSIVLKKESVRVANKRYLNLTVSTRIKEKFVELTKWEKIFVMNYYNKGNVMPDNKNSKYSEVRADIVKALNDLYLMAENIENFSIDPNSKEVIREYEAEIRSLVSRGNLKDAYYLKTHRESALKEMARKYTKTLYLEYCFIVDLLKKTNYEPAFKYLMLNETLTKTYRQQKIDEDINNLVGRREINSTIKSHMNFNEIVLGVIYNNLEDYSNFANLYFAGLSILNKNIYEENNVTLDGVDTFGKGNWIRFEGKKNSPTSYIKNAQILASMVQDSPWCTKQQASLHLEEGDFYLFVDNDNKPRIGVKLIGDRIDEVRGVKNGNAQELEEEYRDVAIEFLLRNKDIKFGREWLEKEEWNKRLVEYCKKIDSSKLSKQELNSLIYDLTEVFDYKAHYAQCGNRLELLSKIKKLRKVKRLLAKKYDCRPSEIFIGNVTCRDVLKGKFPYKVVLGNLDFNGYLGPRIDFSKLEVVLGNCDFSNSNVDNLDNLKIIGGSGSFSHVRIDKIDNLIRIGEIGEFFSANIGSMEKLEEIGGTASMFYAKIGRIPNLKIIGEDAHFEHSNIGDLSSLEFIYGNAFFTYCNILKINDFVCEGKVRDADDLPSRNEVEENKVIRR